MELEPFRDWLAGVIAKEGLDASGFSHKSKISESNLSRWLSGKARPSVDKCLELARYLNRRPVEVLMRAGRLPMDVDLLDDLDLEAKIDLAVRRLSEGVEELRGVRTDLQGRPRVGNAPPRSG